MAENPWQISKNIIDDRDDAEAPAALRDHQEFGAGDGTGWLTMQSDANQSPTQIPS